MYVDFGAEIKKAQKTLFFNYGARDDDDDDVDDDDDLSMNQMMKSFTLS